MCTSVSIVVFWVVENKPLKLLSDNTLIKFQSYFLFWLSWFLDAFPHHENVKVFKTEIHSLIEEYFVIY